MFVVAFQNSSVGSAAPCISGGDSYPCSFIHCEYIFRVSLQIINKIVWMNPEFSLILYKIRFLIILFPACVMFFFVGFSKKDRLVLALFTNLCAQTYSKNPTEPEVFFYEFLKRFSRDVFLLVQIILKLRRV